MAKAMFALQPAPVFAHLGRNRCFSAAEAGPGACALPTASMGVPGEPDQKVSCQGPGSNRHHGQEADEQGEDIATESSGCAASIVHRHLRSTQGHGKSFPIPASAFI